MSWSDEDIQNVWNKGHQAANNEPSKWRKDDCSAWISRAQYGNRDSKYGWEIDHTNSNGGDGLSNLRPLEWKNNASKQDGTHTCPVTANGTDNVDNG